MRSIYLLPLSNDELTDSISCKILSSHKNASIFYPILPQGNKGVGLNYAFGYEEALSLFMKNKSAFFEECLERFEAFKKTQDFVLIHGLKAFAFEDIIDFSINLAKDFNSPLYTLAAKEDKPYLQAKIYKLLGKDFSIICCKDDSLKQIDEYDFFTTARFFYSLRLKLKQKRKSVVLPEADDERILRAAAILLDLDLVDIILLGDEKSTLDLAAKYGLSLKGATFINPLKTKLHDEFASTLHELRKHKGVDLEKASSMVEDRTYFGTMLVHLGHADAMVSGASTTTAETVRPALQIIKTKKGISSVSGVFFVCLKDHVYLFADCAVNTNPNPKTLAEIASVSAATAKDFGIDPKVAILSYSTGLSASGKSVDDSLAVINELKSGAYGDFCFEGPIQFDAAVDAAAAKTKMPDSKVAGHANVFIFPDLNAANICYKAVQRTAGAVAVGPALQGLKKPVNDLSRGCLVEDIVQTVILSAVQSGE